MLVDEVLRMLRQSAAVLGAFVLLSLVFDGSRSSQHELTGVVTEWRAGVSIRVANERTDPGGVPLGPAQHRVRR
jgi:hypothetical protein